MPLSLTMPRAPRLDEGGKFLEPFPPARDPVGTPEKVADGIGVVQVKIKTCAAGKFTLHIPVVPRIAADARRQPAEKRVTHFPVFPGSNALFRMRVFWPRPDAHADVEKSLRGFDRLFQLRQFFAVAADRFFAENVLSCVYCFYGNRRY